MKIAPSAMTARLPQKLMNFLGRILASRGHVDRAWATSFQTIKDVAQTQGFRDVVGKLKTELRVGQMGHLE